jgi:hypothetical protein
MPFLSNNTPPATANRIPRASKLISEREIDKPRPFKVIYIGAGVSGIVGAIQFRKFVPNLELVIYEKNADVGGTWYENRYPGCACGTYYDYKFALNCTDLASQTYLLYRISLASSRLPTGVSSTLPHLRFSSTGGTLPASTIYRSTSSSNIDVSKLAGTEKSRDGSSSY